MEDSESPGPQRNVPRDVARILLMLAAAALGLVRTGVAEDPLDELRLQLEQVESGHQRLGEHLIQSPSDFAVMAAQSSHVVDSPSPEYQGVSGAMKSVARVAQPVAVVSPTVLPPAPPRFPTVRLTGFFQADAVWVTQSPDNMITLVAGAPMGDAQDGADFRRARLAAVGDVWENVGYMVEMDFAFPGRPSFMDVWLDVRDLPVLGQVRVGQWRQPFSMDGLTSVRELMFLERALPFAFIPFRQIGAGFYDSDDELGATWAASVFRYPTDPFGGNVGDNGGYGLIGRATLLALEYDDNTTVHVGGGYAFVDPSNNFVRFRNTPELFVGETAGSLAPTGVPTNLPAFVDTDNIPAQNFNLYGMELAGSWGAWLAQSEVMITTVNRISASNVTFWGAYAQLACVLTGEHHSYNQKGGFYTRIVPDHPFKPSQSDWGAWEVAGRWSTIDLNDADVNGNQLTDLTLGLNWYLNGFAKVQFNYVHAMVDSAGTGRSSADLFAMRAQLDF